MSSALEGCLIITSLYLSSLCIGILLYCQFALRLQEGVQNNSWVYEDKINSD